MFNRSAVFEGVHRTATMPKQNGRPTDSPEVRASKTLAYILRHGAEKEGLAIRSDGLVKLADVVSGGCPPLVLTHVQMARPKVKDIDQATVFKLVADNSKKRFALVWGYDPSPPKPKKKAQPKKKKPVTDGETIEQVTLAMKAASVEPEWKELEFVKLSPPLSAFPNSDLVTAYDGGEIDGESDDKAEWFIRAVQGHTLKLDSGHLEELRDDENGKQKAGLLVHGTKWQLWETISEFAVAVRLADCKGTPV